MNADYHRPLIFSGPSGVGKSTLFTMLMQKNPESFGFRVSHTTRSPRAGESNGTHYHFVSREHFEAGIARGDFIEHTQFAGNLYGTSKAAIDAVKQQGRICILDVDEVGVRNIKTLDGFMAYYIFIRPPSIAVLTERLRARGSETEASLQRRIATVEASMQLAEQPGMFDIIIVNDDLEKAYDDLRSKLSEKLHTQLN